MELLKKYRIALIIGGISILVLGMFFVLNKKEKVNNILEQQVKQLPLKVEAVPVNFEIIKGESNNLKAVFTNDSQETILTFTIEVLLKDTNEVIEMKWSGAVSPGEQSSQITDKAPKSGNIDDVKILKYKISVQSGTYMEYNSELNQYNWS